MLKKTNIEAELSSVLSGDLEPLLKQVGDHAEWASLALAAVALRYPSIDNLPALRQHLQHYRDHLLLPQELPVIHQANQLAKQGAVRELIALDQDLALRPEFKPFASASQRVGWIHLQRLRPLRDQRVVRRYCLAVEQNQAHAWHTLVYGLILCIYSIPHRQGLLNYAHLTLRGFIRAAARSIRLSERDEQHLLDELLTAVPPVLTTLVPEQPNGFVCLS